MRRGMKNKKVSWAPDVNLCQVRMFLSDESPSQVGLSAQDHLQAKKSWLLHSNGVSSDDNLPPGFETAQPANEFENMLSQIPVTKWRFPYRLILNADWQVVAGEESKEVELQNQRELRVLEAVYPRPSAIPQNPALSMATEDSHHNNWQAPLIPINPIEDEDVVAGDASHDLISPMSTLVNSNSLTSERSATGKTLDEESDVAVTASAAFTSIMKTNENLIDRDLLIKLLNSPTLIQKMIKENGAEAANPQSIHHPVLWPVNQHSNPPISQINRMETSTSSTATATGNIQPHSNGEVSFTEVRLPPPPPPISVPQSAVDSKDVNYYKTLIHHHGGERRETLPQSVSHHKNETLGTTQGLVSNSKPTKIMKPCIYFNSSRGCRNGANCTFQHDKIIQQQQANSMPEVQSAKRMKFDKDITGT